MSKLAPTAFVALSLFAFSNASAESKSWAALKGSVTPKATIVFGGNLDAARNTKLFGSAVTMMQNEDEIGEALTLIKDVCQIDVPASITDFSVVMKKDEKPLVALGLRNLDEGRLVSCLEAIALKKTGQSVKLSGKRKGKITAYSIPGEKKKIHVAWLAKDVVAFTDDPTSAGKLAGMLAGKAAKGQLAKGISRVDTEAPLWASVAMKEKEDGMTILGGWGDVKVAGTKFAGSLHVQMATPDEAQRAVAMGEQGLTEVKGQMPAKSALSAVLASVKLGATGNEVDVSASLADADVQKLIADFAALF